MAFMSLTRECVEAITLQGQTGKAADQAHALHVLQAVWGSRGTYISHCAHVMSAAQS